MFLISKFNGEIGKWNVSEVKDMSYMFAESEFKGDISKWNFSNVKDMSSMFCLSEIEYELLNSLKDELKDF